MLDPELVAPVEAAVRALATAARTLRLYPASSPIPRQAVEAAVGPLALCLRDDPSLVLTVARAGFTCRNTAVAGSVGSAADLADALSERGVAELVVLPGITADELLAMLEIVSREPEELRAAGGVAAVLDAAGLASVRVVEVSLVVTPEMEEPAEGEDVDDFFRELAFDPAKLTTWLAAATRADTFTLSAGLGELADAAGPDGLFRFFESFATAFVSQDGEGRDALLALGLEQGRVRDLIGGMLGNLGTTDIASSLDTGLYGRNMLSLSTALAGLPLGARLDEVIAEVRANLPELGHDAHEMDFLDHMLDVRTSREEEESLTESDPTFRRVVEASRLDAAMFDHTKAEVAGAVARVDSRAVTTMLTLLDQQRDFDLYVRSLDALAAIVPRLIAQGDLGMAITVLHEIAERESRTTQPWPELTSRLRAALATATGGEAMSALLDVVTGDFTFLPQAHDILRVTEDSSKARLVEEALARRSDDALKAAEAMLGRRIVDMLVAIAPRVPAAQVGPLARLLACHGGARGLAALEAVMARPDEESRIRAAEALGAVSDDAAVKVLGLALRDQSAAVASAAARSLARVRTPLAAALLAERLGELDVDGRDFAAARELIGWLAQSPDPAAGDALRRLAERRAIMKRGRFAEVQQLAREALSAQSLKVTR